MKITKETMSEDDGGLGRSWTRAEDRMAIKHRHTKVHSVSVTTYLAGKILHTYAFKLVC